MTDYSKPTHWWCVECCDADFAGDDSPTCPCGGRNIPRFAVIPEGQRPEADEPDEETVCISSSLDGDGVEVREVEFAADYGARIQPLFAWGRLDEPLRLCGNWKGKQGKGTLADAVLWVAEGRLP